MASVPDERIEKRIFLKAPRSRVWRALADAREFATWFGLGEPTGAFVPGGRVRAQVRHPGHEHVVFEVAVERVEPERHLSFRGMPSGAAPDELPTLVEFTLEDGEGGTWLTIVESGFEKLPPGRRTEAYRGNVDGWDFQANRIAEHLDAHP